MSGKTIEIEKGDTFTITELGALFRYSGRKCFNIDGSSAGFKRASGERDITAAQFRTIAEIAGYAVTEKPAEAEFVSMPFPEWGVDVGGGKIRFFTSKENAIANGGRGAKLLRFGGASNG